MFRQATQQFGVGLFEESGGKLVQQVPYFFRHGAKEQRFFVGSMTNGLRAHQGMFQRPGHLGQVSKTHRSGTASQ